MRKKTILIFTIIGMILLTGCSKNIGNTTTTTNNNNNSFNKPENEINMVINKLDNVDIKYDYTINNDLLLTIKNKYDTNLSIAFFDKDNKLIKAEVKYLYNNMDTTYRVYISDIYEKTKRIEITPNVIKNYQKYNHYESAVKLDYNVDKSTNKVVVTLNNTSGEIIDNVSYSVYFYKNNKVIDMLDFTYANVGEISTQNVYMPSDTTKNKAIDYDKIDVKLESAIKYINE